MADTPKDRTSEPILVDLLANVDAQLETATTYTESNGVLDVLYRARHLLRHARRMLEGACTCGDFDPK